MLMDDVHLSTARHFRCELHLRLSAENFQQQFGAREVCRASQACSPLKIQYQVREQTTLNVTSNNSKYSPEHFHFQTLPDTMIIVKVF